MMILHISKRRIAVMAVSFMVIAAVTVVLAGCFSDKENTITLADTAEMADYLQQLGWQVEPDPIETLDLQLPQTLGDTWGDYAAMQTEQGLPFADFAGQPRTSGTPCGITPKPFGSRTSFSSGRRPRWTPTTT